MSRQLLLDDICGFVSCRANTTCKPYQQLFSDAQWLLLIEAFLAELYRLNSLPPESQLSIHMQVRPLCCSAVLVFLNGKCSIHTFLVQWTPSQTT